ncbi:MAG: hypothetical protein KDE20_11640 [Caldilineaceae bacterium]|nr:hypothetical protein [Caldilineaceae bacterium]
MTQEEINAFVESITAAGVTVESLAAMHALMVEFAANGIDPNELTMLINRANLSLIVSRAMADLRNHDIETAQIDATRAAERADLETAVASAQIALLES